MRPLNPFELWALKSNLNAVLKGETDLETRVALLRAEGYPRMADELTKAYEQTTEKPKHEEPHES